MNRRAGGCLSSRRCGPAALLFALMATSVHAGVPAEARKGAELYRDSAYKEAADAFRQATIAAPDDDRWRYNLGLSEAQSQDFESALNNLETTARTADPRIADAALYNAGNVHYAKGDYQAAARAYRDALRQRPNDPDAKRNLELALRQMQQQQKQDKQKNDQQKPDSSSQKQDQKQKQDQGKDEKSSDQSDQQKQKPGENSEQNPDQSQSDSLNQSRARPDSSVTREQAERILKALADEEARLRDEARHMRALPAPGGKDW
jgi:Ca-activated chloride channel family protein